MKVQRQSSRLLPAFIALLLAACSFSPVNLLVAGRATSLPAIVLQRCDAAHDVLCLLTFGLQPPDQMLVVLSASPGLPKTLEAVITYAGSAVTYSCEYAQPSPDVVYCTGPQLPLGSSMRLEVFATDENTLLASGDFILTALALPTVIMGGPTSAMASPLATVTATRTPRPRPGLPTPLPGATSTAAPSSTPGPGYPNPDL